LHLITMCSLNFTLISFLLRIRTWGALYLGGRSKGDVPTPFYTSIIQASLWSQ
jgi:hypothetical protein